MPEETVLSFEDINRQYAGQLEMTRARGEYWRLAFQGNLHKLTDNDFALLKKDIDAAAKTAAR